MPDRSGDPTTPYLNTPFLLYRHPALFNIPGHSSRTPPRSSGRDYSKLPRPATSFLSSTRTKICPIGDVADKMNAPLVLPHQAIFTSADVTQVNVAEDDVDVLVLSTEPAVVDTTTTAKFPLAFPSPFVLGGFTTVHSNNKPTINTVETARPESPLLIKSDLPTNPSTTLPLLSRCERTSCVMFEPSPHQEPVTIFSRNANARQLTATPTIPATFAVAFHLCPFWEVHYRSPEQQAHNQHGRDCSPGVSSANQIDPADKFFDNPSTPFATRAACIASKSPYPSPFPRPTSSSSLSPSSPPLPRRLDPGGSAAVHPTMVNSVETAPLESPLLIKSVLPASSSTTLPLLSRCERTSYITFEPSPHREPVAIPSRNANTPPVYCRSHHHHHQFATTFPLLRGFATVHHNNMLTINTVEVTPWSLLC